MIGFVVVLALLSPSCYHTPVASPIIDPFRAPACSFCPGNRGLEYQPVVGSTVVAAADGVVMFSGVVAGVRYLVVQQSDGRLATYGLLAAAEVVVGAVIRAGQVIATTTDRFFFGLRQADRYIDPAPFLGSPHYRPRLVPIDGSSPRPAPAPAI